METPTTLRGEIRKVLAESKDPLTRVEIFAKCKFCADEKTLSTVLSQLLTAGDIKKAGELERIGARTLALYTIAGGGLARIATTPKFGEHKSSSEQIGEAMQRLDAALRNWRRPQPKEART